MTTPARFRLYTRRGCHLCERARGVAGRVAAAANITLDLLDVDSDPVLCERYDLRVPVLALGAQELDWPFDAAAVRRLLTGTI